MWHLVDSSRVALDLRSELFYRDKNSEALMSSRLALVALTVLAPASLVVGTDVRQPARAYPVFAIFHSPTTGESVLITHGPRRYGKWNGKTLIDLSGSPLAQLFNAIDGVDSVARNQSGHRHPYIVVGEFNRADWLELIDEQGRPRRAISISEADRTSRIYRDSAGGLLWWGLSGRSDVPVSISPDGMAVLSVTGVLDLKELSVGSDP